MTTVTIAGNPSPYCIHTDNNARAFRRGTCTNTIVTVSSSSEIAGRVRLFRQRERRCGCRWRCVEKRNGYLHNTLLRLPGRHSEIVPPAPNGGQRIVTTAEQQEEGGGGRDDNRSNSTRSTSKSIGRNKAVSSRLEYDVVIVGAGIIGIATAHHILQNTNLSVALIDGKRPCAGATGAGQGYIWMSHRMPGNPGWDLASRSKCLWEELALELRSESIDPLKAMGWRKTGSLLVASTNDEMEGLQNCVAAASAAGVPAEFLSAGEARKAEPALDHLAAAAFFPEDSQIDARLAVELLQQRIRTFASSGRYKELFQNPVHQFIRSLTDGRVQGVKTQNQEVYCKKAVVVATGAWSSSMMSKATAEWGLSIVPPVKPRKERAPRDRAKPNSSGEGMYVPVSGSPPLSESLYPDRGGGSFSHKRNLLKWFLQSVYRRVTKTYLLNMQNNVKLCGLTCGRNVRPFAYHPPHHTSNAVWIGAPCHVLVLFNLCHEPRFYEGHLLVLKGAESFHLRHGLMEFEYLSHAKPSVPTSEAPEGSGFEVEPQPQSSLELAMTATMDQDDNLLLGSSREFVDFNNEIHDYVVESIMNRARQFFGALSHVSLKHALQSGSVRTGLRPFIGDGRPLIGPIQDVPGLIFATGHEGSGLCLSLGTAEMVVNIIQEVGSVVDWSFFSPVDRLVPPSEN